MIAAATGMKRVEIKKNSASVDLMSGRTDSPYAAGIARRSTIRVDITLAVNELVRYAAKPRSRTSWKRSNVSSVKKVGVLVAAARSDLKAVKTIHATGKKKPSTITQVTRVMTEEVTRLRTGRRRVAVRVDI